MDANDNGLSLEGLAQRLEALEQENERMRSENHTLKRKVATLEGSGTLSTEDGEPPASEWSVSDGQVSRKWLLSKAGAAAVGAVAAGALMLRDTREARADHLDPGIFVDFVTTHDVFAQAENGTEALIGTTTSDDRGAVLGENHGSGPGVRGTNEGTGPAVEGTAIGLSGMGVKGTGRYGVWGESNQAGFYGVICRNTNTDGTGVWGRGPKRGVLGESTTGIGLEGNGKNGVYGESSTEGQNGVWGKHTNKGAGVSGEGRVGVIGTSHEDGWNGVWGRHTTNGRGVAGDSATGVGVWGESSAPDLGAIEGHNNGGGSGVVGVGKIGMLAFSHVDGWNAVWGRHTTNGTGVAGDSDRGPGVTGKSTFGLGVSGETISGPQGVFGRAGGASSQGVAGEGLNGTGVLGKGRTGVVGSSTGTGYGGEFGGGKAQLRMVPKSSAGAPSGTHTKGELYMDVRGTLYICVADSTSTAAAKWRKVTTTAV